RADQRQAEEELDQQPFALFRLFAGFVLTAHLFLDRSNLFVGSGEHARIGIGLAGLRLLHGRTATRVQIALAAAGRPLARRGVAAGGGAARMVLAGGPVVAFAAGGGATLAGKRRVNRPLQLGIGRTQFGREAAVGSLLDADRDFAEL